MAFDNQDTYNKIVTVVADALHIDKATITPSSTLDSLGADSLDKLEIIMKLEETFGIEINDEQAAQINTIQEAIDKINALRTK